MLGRQSNKAENTQTQEVKQHKTHEERLLQHKTGNKLTKSITRGVSPMSEKKKILTYFPTRWEFSETLQNFSIQHPERPLFLFMDLLDLLFVHLFVLLTYNPTLLFSCVVAKFLNDGDKERNHNYLLLFCWQRLLWP